MEIASGEPPDASMLELLFGDSFITPQFLDDEKFSEEFEDFISTCLKSDPEEVYIATKISNLHGIAAKFYIISHITEIIHRRAAGA